MATNLTSDHTISSITTLPVMEAFYTIQGEGYYQGHAGCDVGCVWCDVKESWDELAHPKQSIEQIVTEAAAYPARLAVITGGEPLMHDLSALTSQLHQQGFTINIETSGAHPLSGELDWICLSPKKFKKALPEFYPVADELKIIVYHKSDFEWAESYASVVQEKCKLLLQPEWSKEAEMLPLIIDYVKENPKWNISLQTHKYMDIP